MVEQQANRFLDLLPLRFELVHLFADLHVLKHDERIE
jgi:hypothetical protein